MSTINSNSTLRVEDYPATYRKDLLPRLFQSLNLFITQVISTVNGNIEFGVNIPAQDNFLEFNFDGSYPNFKWALKKVPNFIVVGEVLEDGNPIGALVTWSYDSSTGLITISQIVKISTSGVSGLSVGSKYQMELRTLA